MPTARKLKLGDSFLNKGHRYQVVGEDFYPAKDGWLGRLLVLRGSCAVCGSPFRTTSTPSVARPLIRTCPAHRRQYRWWEESGPKGGKLAARRAKGRARQ